MGKLRAQFLTLLRGVGGARIKMLSHSARHENGSYDGTGPGSKKKWDRIVKESDWTEYIFFFLSQCKYAYPKKKKLIFSFKTGRLYDDFLLCFDCTLIERLVLWPENELGI